jgi:hypothetical protein
VEDWRQKHKNKQIVTKNKLSEIKYAFVTFRSMKGKHLALNAYKISAPKRWFLRTSMGRRLRPMEALSVLRKHFFMKWPYVREADMPDNIQYANLMYRDQRKRNLWAWLSAVGILIIVTIIIILLKLYVTHLDSLYGKGL